jgi:hypothetical protein
MGTFVDSNIYSDPRSIGNTEIIVDDANSSALIKSGNAQIGFYGLANIVRITGIDVDVVGNLNINTHLGLALLRFQGSTASFPALRRNGAELDVRLANDSAFANINANNVTANNDIQTSRSFVTIAKSVFESVTNGNFTLYNAAKNAFSLLQFGGITNLFPSLKRSTTELQVRLADDSAFAPFRSSTISLEGGGLSIPSGAMNIYAGTATSNSILYGNLSGLSMGKGAVLPVASAFFEMQSTTRGFLPPRMTAAQRTAISAPAVGLMVYQTDGGAAEGIWTNKSTGWVQGV